MKRTRLIAMLVAMTTIATLAADASAYYHPTVGRFISRDPGPGRLPRPGTTTHFLPRDPTGTNQYADGMNLYEYVRSHPVGRMDPSGTVIRDRHFEHDWKHGETVNIKVNDYYPGAGYGGGYTDKRQYEVGKLKWLGKSGMNSIALSNGGTVGYWMARHWVENKNWDGTKESFLAFAKAHDARQSCGPDVTKALKDVLVKIRNFYEPLTPPQKYRSCCAVFSFVTPDGLGINWDVTKAWDINQLHWMAEKGRRKIFDASAKEYREPSRSVQISGKCYDSAAVNFVMWGLMGKLCNKEPDFLIGRVKTWKKNFYGTVPTYETIDWIKAGFNGWTPETKVPSTTPYVVNKDPKRKQWDAENFPFTFHWLPYKEPEE